MQTFKRTLIVNEDQMWPTYLNFGCRVVVIIPRASAWWLTSKCVCSDLRRQSWKIRFVYLLKWPPVCLDPLRREKRDTRPKKHLEMLFRAEECVLDDGGYVIQSVKEDLGFEVPERFNMQKPRSRVAWPVDSTSTLVWNWYLCVRTPKSHNNTNNILRYSEELCGF